MQAAVYRAIYTEANAKLLLQAKMLGGPINYLAPEEAAIMEEAQAQRRPGRVAELAEHQAAARPGHPQQLAQSGW